VTAVPAERLEERGKAVVHFGFSQNEISLRSRKMCGKVASKGTCSLWKKGGGGGGKRPEGRLKKGEGGLGGKRKETAKNAKKNRGGGTGEEGDARKGRPWDRKIKKKTTKKDVIYC